eukprot:7631256-Pyramimonas_sp.AAC.1
MSLGALAPGVTATMAWSLSGSVVALLSLRARELRVVGAGCFRDGGADDPLPGVPMKNLYGACCSRRHLPRRSGGASMSMILGAWMGAGRGRLGGVDPGVEVGGVGHSAASVCWGSPGGVAALLCVLGGVNMWCCP